MAVAMCSAVSAGERGLLVHRANLRDYRACGPTCLYLAFQMLGIDATFKEISELVDVDGDESSSFANLSSVARQKGLWPLAVNLTSDELNMVRGPAIVHMRSAKAASNGPGDHFMVYLGQPESGGVVLLDAPRSPFGLPRGSFDTAWTGNILILARSQGEMATLHDAIDGRRASRTIGVLLVMMLIMAGGAVRLWKPLLIWSRRSTNRAASAQCAQLKAIVVIVSAMVGGGCGNAGTPKFVVDDVVPFGVVALQDHEAQVHFQNLGNAPLEVFSVSAQCNCTVTTATRNTAPGGEGTIVVKLRGVPPGPGASRLSVSSNDPRSPHAVFVRWFGEHPPKLAPSAISRSDLSGGATFEQLVRIIYAGGDPDLPITVKAVESSNPAIIIRRSDSVVTARYNRDGALMNAIAIAGEIDYLVRCQLPSMGELAGDCRFEVEQAGQAYSLVMPVRLAVGPPLSVSPASLYLSCRDRATLVGAKKQLVLTLRCDKNPTLFSAPRFLRCTIRAGSEQPRKGASTVYFLVSEVIQSPPLGDNGPIGTIGLGVGDDAAPLLNIPVYLRLVQ